MDKSGRLDPRFWMLINPLLPVGGYSFSHGLESAVEQGWVRDFSSTQTWIRSLGERVLVNLELPVLQRLLEAFLAQDDDACRYWNDVSHASRESAELLLEEQAKGQALVRLFDAFGVENHWGSETHGFTSAFAQICCHWQIDRDTAMQGYAWIWIELLVAAAVKSVPLGHSDGQRLLLNFTQLLPEFVAQAKGVADQDIGSSAPGLAMLSSAHETQHARVFRS